MGGELIEVIADPEGLSLPPLGDDAVDDVVGETGQASKVRPEYGGQRPGTSATKEEVSETEFPGHTDLQKSLDSTAVVAALVAAISFVGMLVPPTPSNDAALVGGQLSSSQTHWRDAFLYSGALAFSFSLAAVLLCIMTIPSSSAVLVWQRRWRFINILLLLAIWCFCAAFLAAGSITLGSDSAGKTKDMWFGVAAIIAVAILISSAYLLHPPKIFERWGLA